MEVVTERLVICDEEVAVVLVLQIDPVVEGSHVVAYVECSGGADAGEDSFLCAVITLGCHDACDSRFRYLSKSRF